VQVVRLGCRDDPGDNRQDDPDTDAVRPVVPESKSRVRVLEAVGGQQAAGEGVEPSSGEAETLLLNCQGWSEHVKCSHC
jgi:hypothetical protein